jgi:hypothetical protein
MESNRKRGQGSSWTVASVDDEDEEEEEEKKKGSQVGLKSNETHQLQVYTDGVNLLGEAQST